MSSSNSPTKIQNPTSSNLLETAEVVFIAASAVGLAASLVWEQSVYAQGAIVISAAGNDARPQVDYPARFANEVGIAVGGVTRNGLFGEYSNRAGSQAINYFVAPGGDGGRADSGDVYSTVALSQPGIPYRYFSGTSMGVPQVSGVVALMLQANPNLTPADIKRILAETANRAV